MSGGHFDYKQYQLEDIADSLDRLIANNNPKDDNYHHEFPKDILVKFKITALQLRKTAKMVQRIDWLVCGDDGEDSFRNRWKEDVGK